MNFYVSKIYGGVMETLPARNKHEVDDALIIQVVTIIARKEQCDPLSLPPLTDVVDPDALEQVARGAGVTEISFSYHGYRVSVEGNGHVHAAPE